MEVPLGVAFRLDGELACGVRIVIIDICVILMFCNRGGGFEVFFFHWIVVLEDKGDYTLIDSQ
jgi:hypothetical protein